MSRPTWRLTWDLCPECESRAEGAGGPDFLSLRRCPECGWSRTFDPAADEFTTELDSVPTDERAGWSE